MKQWNTGFFLPSSVTAPNKYLGAWKSPRPFPWLGTALLFTALLLIAIDFSEAQALYSLHSRMEDAVVVQNKKMSASKMARPHSAHSVMVETISDFQASSQALYQTKASLRAWNVLASQFQHDPAGLFIALENSLIPNVVLLSVELNENQDFLVLNAESKSIEAIEEWRKLIAHQPLFGSSRVLKEKWMPEQFGVKPLQLMLEIPIQWKEINAVLESSPSKKMPAASLETLTKVKTTIKRLSSFPWSRVPSR